MGIDSQASDAALHPGILFEVHCPEGESVPEQHDLIPGLGRGPEPTGGALHSHLTDLDV